MVAHPSTEASVRAHGTSFRHGDSCVTSNPVTAVILRSEVVMHLEEANGGWQFCTATQRGITQCGFRLVHVNGAKGESPVCHVNELHPVVAIYDGPLQSIKQALGGRKQIREIELLKENM